MIHRLNRAAITAVAAVIISGFRSFCRSERHAGLGMNGGFPSKLLPSPNRAIDKAWLDLHQSRAAFRSLSSDQSGTSAAEWIKDDAV